MHFWAPSPDTCLVQSSLCQPGTETKSEPTAELPKAPLLRNGVGVLCALDSRGLIRVMRRAPCLSGTSPAFRWFAGVLVPLYFAV